MYMRFLSSLAFGLIGLGMVLKVLLDGIFNEWDAFNDIAGKIAQLSSGRGSAVEHVRAEDILMEAEKQNAYSLVSQGIRLTEQRHQHKQELDEIEFRLSQIPGPLNDPAVVPS